MSCPVIKLTVTRGYHTNGGFYPDYFYHSTAFVEVISGTSTSPLSGTLTLTDINDNITVLNLSNPGGSFTTAQFNLTDSAFYDNYKANFIITTNSVCIHTKYIPLGYQAELPCTTVISESDPSMGDPIITENCYGEYILNGEIYGCTDPSSNNYNTSATINDGSCIYLSGCTNPASPNYNPNATIDDGSCAPVYGCMDPLSTNYNPNATINDGTCVYVGSQPILGCTNPMASNYNANATFNDGSCIFLSGCTNPLADNYNATVSVDDGSCECNKSEILFTLDGENNLYFFNSGDTKCDYYLEFDYRIILNCTSVLDYFESKPTLTILDIVDKVKVYSEVRSNDNYYRQIELDINPKDIFYFELSGDTSDCFTLKSLISFELGNDCPQDINDKFNNKWLSARLKIPNSFLNKNVNLGLYLEGFTFSGGNILLDNIKVFSLCYSEQNECIIVPYNFGFELDLIPDNKKSHVSLNGDLEILNTKEIDLKVDVPNYVKSDVIAFLNKNEKLYHKIFKNLTVKKLEEQFIPVSNLLISSNYYYWCHLYEQYLNSFKYCSAKSKELDYYFMFEVINKIGDEWYQIVKQFLPETAIWNENSRFYSNFIFHQQKFNYKNYLNTLGTDRNEVFNVCEFKTLDKCDQQIDFSYAIDIFEITNDNLCLIDNNVVPTNISETTTGGGRLLQYDKSTNTQIIKYNYPNQYFEPCI